jgi:hypothetical protein
MSQETPKKKDESDEGKGTQNTWDLQIKRSVGALQKYDIQTMLLLDLLVVTNLLTLLWRAILKSLTRRLQMIHLSLSLSLSLSH